MDLGVSLQVYMQVASAAGRSSQNETVVERHLQHPHTDVQSERKIIGKNSLIYRTDESSNACLTHLCCPGALEQSNEQSLAGCPSTAFIRIR